MKRGNTRWRAAARPTMTNATANRAATVTTRLFELMATIVARLGPRWRGRLLAWVGSSFEWAVHTLGQPPDPADLRGHTRQRHRTVRPAPASPVHGRRVLVSPLRARVGAGGRTASERLPSKSTAVACSPVGRRVQCVGGGRNLATNPGDWQGSTRRMLTFCKEHDIGWSYWAYSGANSLVIPRTNRPKPDLLPILQRVRLGGSLARVAVAAEGLRMQ